MEDNGGLRPMKVGETYDFHGRRYLYTEEDLLIGDDGEVIDLRTRGVPSEVWGESSAGGAGGAIVEAIMDNWFVLAGISGVIGNRADALLQASIRRLRRATRLVTAGRETSFLPLHKTGTRALGEALQDLAINAFKARLAELGEDVSARTLRANAWTGDQWPPGAVVLSIDGGPNMSGRVIIRPSAPPERQIEVIVRIARSHRRR